MARQWTIRSVDHPNLRPSRPYRVRVVDVARGKGRSGIRIKLTHVDGEQDGRTHEILLPLPFRPAGLTASFFEACGFEVGVGTEIAPKDTMGRTLLATFAPNETGAWQVVAFQKEANDGK